MRAVCRLCSARRCLQRAYTSSASVKDHASGHTDVADSLDALVQRGTVSAILPDTLLRDGAQGKDARATRHEQRVDARLSTASPCVYVGFDPSASSLHIGSLVVLANMLRLGARNFKLVFLVGGATGRLGDPSGKDSERPALSLDAVRQNGESLARQIHAICGNFDEHVRPTLDNDADCAAGASLHYELVDNAQWYDTANVVDFVSTVGRRFRVGAMMKRQSVRRRRRRTHGLALQEFMYQVFQANDWLQLYERYGCQFQLGGIDQLGNFDAGYHYAKSAHHGREPIGLLCPLLTDKHGEKLGKTAGDDRTVWLDAGRTTAFSLYQHLTRVPDSDVLRLLRYLTFYPLEEVEAMCDGRRDDPWHAQKMLATQCTLLVHGAGGLALAERCTSAFYHRTSPVAALSALSQSDMAALVASTPSSRMRFPAGGLSAAQLAHGAGTFDTLANARNIVAAGGFHLNGVRLRSPTKLFATPGEVFLPGHDGLTLLRIGKRQYVFIEWI